MTRTVTSAAALAALALVCGPALERTGDGSAAAAAAAIGTSSPTATTGAAPQQQVPVLWNGPLPIRPSRFAQAPGGSVAGLPVVETVPVGPPGEVGALGIPLMVLRAYHLAADRVDAEQPSCKLPWWLLAGIGHTESGHAESGRLTADGTTRGRILGPQLSGGIPGDAVITDTDHGVLDGDPVYDRAVGPMQFIPSTWARWGVDGNGDGKSDPSNIFDATLAAADYLCADGRDLSTEAGLEAAVLSYNHSAAYLATVLAWGEAYRDGASALPDSPLPVVSDVTKVRPPKSSRPPAHAPIPSTSASSPSQTSASASASASPTATGSSSGAGGSSAPGSSSASTSPSASASPTCSSASPSPTDSSSDPVDPATGQSHTGSSAASRRGLSGSASTSGSPVATPSRSDTSSSSRSHSATAQLATAQSATGETASATTTDSSSASASPSSCAP